MKNLMQNMCNNFFLCEGICSSSSISVSLFLWRHLLLLLLHFCLCFLSIVCHLNAMAGWGSRSSGGVMDEIIDLRNKAVVTFIALSDLLRHCSEQTEGEINCSGSHRSCHANTDQHRIQCGSSDLFCFSHTLCHLWPHWIQTEIQTADGQYRIESYP